MKKRPSEEFAARIEEAARNGQISEVQPGIAVQSVDVDAEIQNMPKTVDQQADPLYKTAIDRIRSLLNLMP